MKKLLPFLVPAMLLISCSTTISETKLKKATVLQISDYVTKGEISGFRSGDDSNALQFLIASGNSDAAEFLIKSQMGDVNHMNIYGETPLSTACRYGSVSTVKLLVEHTSVINVPPYEKNPLMSSVEGNKDENYAYLISQGADTAMVTANQSHAVYTALYFDNPKLAALLLKSGCSQEVRDDKKNTPLIYCALEDKPQTFSFLINKKVDLESTNEDHLTPLLAAISTHNDGMVSQLIVAGASIERETAKNLYPLSYAITSNNESAVRLLLDAGVNVRRKNAKGEPPVLQAYMENHDNIALLLIQKKADILFTTSDDTPFIAQILYDSRAKVYLKPLLDAGISPEMRSSKSAYPLFIAITLKDDYAVETLADAHAKLTITDSNGNYPLHAAVDKGSLANVQKLVAAGEPVDQVNKSGITPLILAFDNGYGDIGEYLISENADIYFTDPKGKKAVTYRRDYYLSLAANYRSKAKEQLVLATKYDKNASDEYDRADYLDSKATAAETKEAEAHDSYVAAMSRVSAAKAVADVYKDSMDEYHHKAIYAKTQSERDRYKDLEFDEEKKMWEYQEKERSAQDDANWASRDESDARNDKNKYKDSASEARASARDYASKATDARTTSEEYANKAAEAEKEADKYSETKAAKEAKV